MNVTINTSIAAVGSHTRNASLSSAVSLAVPATANVLQIQAETQNVRYTLDGTTPTSTVGFLLYAGMEQYMIAVPVNGTVKIIEVTSGGVVNYQFMKY